MTHTPADPSALPLANLRDLGGLAVTGGRIRAGLVLRADDVSTTTPEQVAELVQAGLDTIIDLRSPEEAARTGRGPAADHDVAYLALPMTEASGAPSGLAERILASVTTPEQVGHWYAKLFVDQGPALVTGLQAIAEADGAVLFHCAAGKDRTGLFAAALLSVLGADDAAIVADYARTDERLPAVYKRIAATLGQVTGGRSIPLDHPVLAADPRAMDSMLASLRQRGGAAAVLRAAGLADDTVAKLRGRLVEPASAEL